MRPSSTRVLAAVLFTDIVDSTSVAEELGDRRWKALIGRHHRIVRRELKRFGGRELDTAGDGFFASFREPASAVACACAVVENVRELGIEIRAGIHFGECERVGKKLGGITVVVGSRISALGGAGDVLVSGTAAELARGAQFGFEDRGFRSLKGVEGEWRVMAATSVEGTPRTPPLDPEEAKARRDAVLPEKEVGRRRTAMLVAGVSIAAIAAVIILVAVFAGGPAAPLPGPDSVARIDSERGRFDQIVSVGSNAYPEDVAFGDGKLWIANVTNKTLSEVDPSSGEVRAFGTPSTPTGVSFADGRVWITYGFSSDEQRRVDVLDPADEVLGAAAFSVPDGSYPTASGLGALWIADPLGSTVIRYDPDRQRSSSWVLPTDAGPIDLDVSETNDSPSVWVAAGRQPFVYRLDPANAGVADAFGTGNEVPTALDVAPDGAVWIVSDESDTVLALAPNGTSKLHEVLGDRCDGPSEVTATTDAVWVACAVSRTVVELDPSDGSVGDTLPVGGTPGAMTVDDAGSVWVVVQGA